MMDYAEEFRKIMEKMEKRRNNTEKAKEELKEIMRMLTEIIPDQVTGFGTNKEFHVKASCWDNGWVNYDCNAYFTIKKGKACINGNNGIVFDIDDVNYINFRQLVTALLEFIENLTNITTWDEEVEVIEKIENSLSQKMKDNGGVV